MIDEGFGFLSPRSVGKTLHCEAEGCSAQLGKLGGNGGESWVPYRPCSAGSSPWAECCLQGGNADGVTWLAGTNARTLKKPG